MLDLIKLAKNINGIKNSLKRALATVKDSLSVGNAGLAYAA